MLWLEISIRGGGSVSISTFRHSSSTGQATCSSLTAAPAKKDFLQVLQEKQSTNQTSKQTTAVSKFSSEILTVTHLREELPTSKPDRDNAKAATDLAHMVSYMPPPSPVLAVAATSRHRTTAMSTFSSKILTLIHLRRVANILTHTENAATDLAQMHPPSPLQQQASTEHRYSYVKTT